MDYIAISIALLNLLVSVVRAWRALLTGRLVAVVWILVVYFSFFLVGLAIDGPFRQHRGFTGDVLLVKADTIRYVCSYVLTYNVLLAFGEIVTWRIFGLRRAKIQWELNPRKTSLTPLLVVFLALLIGGATGYWLIMEGSGYRTYVESRASNWPLVFFWASSPFITISVLQKNYLRAVLASLPFLFFAIYLDVRSFALLSLIPAAIIFYFQALHKIKVRRRKAIPLLVKGVVISAVLLALSAVVMHKKAGDMDTGNAGGLPDAGMVYGMGMAFEMTNRIDEFTGYNSLIKYSLNAINPFLRLFNVEIPTIEDTPVHIAQLIDGVPKDYSAYLHYPALWYTDAYVSFGSGGVWLGLLWGILLSLWERLMLRRTLLIGLFLPFYTWHAYMLVRGAISIATVPFMYSIYIVAAVALTFMLLSSKQRRRYPAGPAPLDEIVVRKVSR